MTTPPLKHKTREAWMTAALWGHIDAHFTAAGYDVPPNIRVTCGFPSTHATARKHLRIGECWDPSMSKDQTSEISVSPFIDEPLRVLGILVHEVVHTVVGLKAGHLAPFSQCAKAVGLEGPWSGTTESPTLVIEMARWVRALGEYPHAALSQDALDPVTGDPILVPSSSRKQTTRMILLTCSCGCKIRTTRLWIAKYGGSWACPCGSHLMTDADIGEKLSQ